MKLQTQIFRHFALQTIMYSKNTIRFAFFACLIACHSFVFSQGRLPGMYTDTLVQVKDSLLYSDSLSIIEKSVQIRFNEHLLTSGQDFYVEDLNAIFLSKTAFEQYKSNFLSVNLRLYPVDMHLETTLLDTSLLTRKDKDIYIGYDYTPYSRSLPNPLFNKGLDYDGSFGRGISIGNTQNLVLNSNFNLQLAGELGEGIGIKGVISDANIPIQAEGNTQQLQDFDRVYIELERKSAKLIAGDYQIRNRGTHFMRYNKKLEGLGASYMQETGKYNGWSTDANFAISRGKFARNNIKAVEGNQGPYKLQGNGGERFLIVLSGTEKVYLNGELLTRGQEYDYIISYDRAELTFSPKRLITRESRIIVEFEYADQNYTRSLYTVNTEISREKYGFSFQMYSEQDSRNPSGNISLDSLDRQILFNSGDADSLARRSGIFINQDGYDPGSIQYKLIQDSILVYSNDPDSAIYTAVFSEVGTGNGSYSIDESQSTNGRVYKYVGNGKGNYAPFIQLIAPVQRQVYTFGSYYQYHALGKINTELSVSNQDLNRLSPLEDSDNTGIGIHSSISQEFRLFKNQERRLKLDGDIEYVASGYRALNPYRNSEFNRDWNVDQNLSGKEELLFSAGLSAPLAKFGYVSHTLQSFIQKGFYSGWKNKSNLNIDWRGFKGDVELDWLNAQSAEESSVFIRPTFDVNQKLKIWQDWKLGVFGELEKNERINTKTDSLNENSIRNSYIKVYLENPKEGLFHQRFSVNQRKDAFPLNNQLTDQLEAFEVQWNGIYNGNKALRFDWDMHYRDFMADPNNNRGLESKSTVLGKLGYHLKLLEGGILNQASFQINNGQEPKFEVDYQEVETGKGEYIWIDDNGDEIRQKEEFQIAPFQDQANYIRISLFNNEFTQVQSNTLNFSLRAEGNKFKRNSQNSTNSIPVLKRFSATSNIKLTQSTEGGNSTRFNNPFVFSSSDTSLIAYSSLVSNTLFFNKGNRNFDLQIGNTIQAQKILQTIGYTSRYSGSYFFRSRLNFRQMLDILTRIETGNKNVASESFMQNDYRFSYFNLEPEMQYRFTTQFRAGFSYTYSDKHAQQAIRAQIHSFQGNISIRQKSSSNFNLEISYANINFNGSSGTSLELILLEGLRDGNNFTWNIGYTRRMANNIDLSLFYNGRKPGNSQIVHVANAQIKATF